LFRLNYLRGKNPERAKDLCKGLTVPYIKAPLDLRSKASEFGPFILLPSSLKVDGMDALTTREHIAQ
jgi:hypothetical protein